MALVEKGGGKIADMDLRSADRVGAGYDVDDLHPVLPQPVGEAPPADGNSLCRLRLWIRFGGSGLMLASWAHGERGGIWTAAGPLAPQCMAPGNCV